MEGTLKPDKHTIRFWLAERRSSGMPLPDPDQMARELRELASLQMHAAPVAPGACAASLLVEPGSTGQGGRTRPGAGAGIERSLNATGTSVMEKQA